MGSQQFCLRWNNHQGNMVNVFDSLLTDNLLVDVTLACDGQNLQAHKLILSACSSFFQEILVKNPCKHPIIILKDMTFNDVKAILQFMYKGEVNVSQDQLSALLKTAEALKVKGLAEVTSEQQQEGEKNSILQEALCNNYQRPNAKLCSAGNYVHIPTINSSHMSLVNNHVPNSEVVAPAPPRKRRRKKADSAHVLGSKSPKKIKEQPVSPEPVDVDVCCEESEPRNGVMASMSQSLNDYNASFQAGANHSSMDSQQPQIVHIKQAPLSPPLASSSPQPQEETVLPVEFMEQSLVTPETDEENNRGNSRKKKKTERVVNNCNDAEGDNDNNSSDMLDNHYQDQDSSIIYAADQLTPVAHFNDSSGGGNVTDGMIQFNVDAGPSSGSAVVESKSTNSTGMNLQYEQYKKMWDSFSNTCPLCEKKMFVENRKRHFFTVHSNFRFKCSLCPATYTRKDNLRFHQRIKHPEQLM